jgi:hypothetical protein
MAINHLTKSCRSIADDTKEALIKLKAQKSSAVARTFGPTAPKYWASWKWKKAIYDSKTGNRKQQSKQQADQNKRKVKTKPHDTTIRKPRRTVLITTTKVYHSFIFITLHDFDSSSKETY